MSKMGKAMAQYYWEGEKCWESKRELWAIQSSTNMTATESWTWSTVALAEPPLSGKESKSIPFMRRRCGGMSVCSCPGRVEILWLWPYYDDGRHWHFVDWVLHPTLSLTEWSSEAWGRNLHTKMFDHLFSLKLLNEDINMNTHARAHTHTYAYSLQSESDTHRLQSHHATNERNESAYRQIQQNSHEKRSLEADTLIMCTQTISNNWDVRRHVPKTKSCTKLRLPHHDYISILIEYHRVFSHWKLLLTSSAFSRSGSFSSHLCDFLSANTPTSPLDVSQCSPRALTKRLICCKIVAEYMYIHTYIHTRKTMTILYTHRHSGLRAHQCIRRALARRSSSDLDSKISNFIKRSYNRCPTFLFTFFTLFFIYLQIDNTIAKRNQQSSA